MFEKTAFAHGHRELDDRIIGRLAVDFGEHDIGFFSGEEARALHRRQLERIAEHQDLYPEREKIGAQLLVDH